MYAVIMNAKDLHQLVWMSRPLMQAAETCVEQGLQGTGLTVRMRAVLEILEQHGAQSVPELAAHLDIQRQYVQVMVNETLAAGFTEQRPNPRHKRSPLIALTTKGQSLIGQIISNELKLMEKVGARFNDEDVATALKVVLAVTKAMKSMAGERE